MDAYSRFKEDLFKNALDTINAFEAGLGEEEERRAKDIQDLHQRIENIESENRTLRSENQEWARKYNVLDGILRSQLLPETDDGRKQQSPGDRKNLADFAQLVQDNLTLRRKYRATIDKRRLLARHGPRTPKTCPQGLGDDRSQAINGDTQLLGDETKAYGEFHTNDQVGEDVHAGTLNQNAQLHVECERYEEGTAAKYNPLHVEKRNYPVINVDQAVSISVDGEPLTPVSDSFKEQQNQSLCNLFQKAVAEESDASDDETSSETQFSDTRTQRLEPTRQGDIIEDSDTPVVVSARSIKRKRQALNDVDLPPSKASRSHHAGSREPRKVRVKLESSSQNGDVLPPSTNRVNETMDLDEVGSRIRTPKKSRQSLQGTVSPQSSPLGSSHDDQEEMLDDEYECELLYGRSQSAPVSRTAAHFARVFGDHPSKQSHQSAALQPKDTNTLPRKVQQKGHQTTAAPLKARKIRRDQRFSAVGIMGEDGGNDDTNRKAHLGGRGQDKGPNMRAQESVGIADSSYEQRLERVMNGPPSQTPVLASKVQPQSNRDLTTPRNSTPKENQKSLLNLISPSPNEAKSQRRAKNPVAFRMPPENGMNRQQSEQLRSRPPESLSLGDFVMNPNSRMSYAYAEPVRSRDQRKCLFTCTKLECCGTRFVKAAQIGGVASIRSGLWSSSPPNEEEADEILLLEHLNNDHAELRSMSKTDKANMLAQIRAQQMGNAVGKHKLTGYERARTPPGFWRADMPSTQELEADREESKKLERQKVLERWQEAMAEDGKGLWKFRDE